MSSLPSGLQAVRLGELLRQRTEKVRLRAEGEYERLGVRWYAEGVFRKEKATGSEIKGTNLYQPQAGDFIYNRLLAWKGSFAVVPDEMAQHAIPLTPATSRYGSSLRPVCSASITGPSL